MPARWLNLFFVAILTLSGCSEVAVPAGTVPSPSAPAAAPSPGPGNHQITLDWQGKSRTFELHAPPGFRTGGAKLPLVVVMHYRDGTPATMRAMTGFDAKADKEGFLVAYPQGHNGFLNALICCGSNDDVGFLRTIVERLTAAWEVDADRVYATGISNGADMSFRLAVELPGMFAAIAPVSGGFVGQKALEDPGFKPSRPVSVVAFAGNDDRLITAITTGMRSWYRKLGCTEKPAEWVDPGHTVNVALAPCADGSDTAFYTINHMGHSWPGGTANGLGDPQTKINAVDTMWAFFTAHPRKS